MNKLYLGQIVEKSNVEYSNKNLILSPVGSGKTHFIFNELSKSYEGKHLMLVSTTSLKDSLKMKDGTFTTRSMNNRKKNLKIKDDDIHIMTYSEFGNLVAWRDDFLDSYSAIFCDEIHSLFDYFSFTKSYKLAGAIRALFNSHEEKVIFYFTATIDKIKHFIRNEDPEVLKNVKVINYLQNEEIVSHDNVSLVEYSNISEILDIIDSLDGFKRMGYKGVVFNDRISGMKEVESLLNDKHYNTITIWSVNNKDNPMNEEQLAVRKELLETGEIPKGYDFLIINGAMREGWNLIDDKVELVILNTFDETNRTQARGRVRKDIFLLAGRVYDNHTTLEKRIIRRERSKRAVGKRLNIPLTSEDKESIVKELYVKNENNRLVKWTTIKKAMEKTGYVIKDDRVSINGEMTRVSIVTDPNLAEN